MKDTIASSEVIVSFCLSTHYFFHFYANTKNAKLNIDI
jgi:hypothetical protein